MQPKIILFALCCLAIVSSSPTDAKISTTKISTPQLPIEYFTKNSEIRSVILSPDGKHYLGIIRNKEKEVFGIFDTQLKKITQIIKVRGEGGNIRDVEWVNSERIVYSIYENYEFDKRGNPSGELYGVDIDGRRHEIIFGYRAGQSTKNTKIRKRKATYASHRIIDVLEEDDKHILIASYPWKRSTNHWYYSDESIPQIVKLNIYNGRTNILDTLPIEGSHPVADNNGDVRFAIGVNKNFRSVISYKKTADSDWEKFTLENFAGDRINPLSFSENNQSVYLKANVANGTRAIFLFDLKTQSMEKIFHDSGVDVDGEYYDFAERRIVYVATRLALPKYHYLDPKDKKAKIHKKLMKAFAGQDVVITSASKDGSKMITLTYADNNPGDYFLFDTKTLNADFLMSRNSWVNPDYLAKTESVSFSTRDQQTIYGYLTRPKLAQPGKLPLVVYPHGGPHSRDDWGFDWEVQLLASHGYAVLQVNFRGSSGFGQAFEEKGYGNWGTLMQDDITDATQTLIDQEIVNPNRICIYGASYGGYAALMGSVRDPELYKCAIGSMGVYDLPLLLEEGNIVERLKYGEAYLKETLGTDINELKKRSPANNVEKIKANILLIHGARDNQATISQAISLKNAFDKINKPYEWLELGNEGHGINNAKNRKKVSQKILQFLDKNIGPQSTQSQAGQ